MKEEKGKYEMSLGNRTFYKLPIRGMNEYDTPILIYNTDTILFNYDLLTDLEVFNIITSMDVIITNPCGYQYFKFGV